MPYATYISLLGGACVEGMWQSWSKRHMQPNPADDVCRAEMWCMLQVTVLQSELGTLKKEHEQLKSELSKVCCFTWPCICMLLLLSSDNANKDNDSPTVSPESCPCDCDRSAVLPCEHLQKP